VRKVLTDAAERGLPGDHHFYVSFRTSEPGLRMSQRLREKYPEEMTIILQHQYWDLAPGETFFTVTLKFGGQPKRLSIPYTAVVRFFDPSVQFGLQFEPPGAEPAPAPLAAVTQDAAHDEPEPVAETAAKVVSLDQFRKK
jgi:hypothetical protein